MWGGGGGAVKQVMKDTYRILDGKYPGKRPPSILWKPKKVIRMDLKEIRCEGRKGMKLPRNSVERMGLGNSSIALTVSDTCVRI